MKKITLSDAAYLNIESTLRDAVLESAHAVTEEYTDEKFERLTFDVQAFDSFVTGTVDDASSRAT